MTKFLAGALLAAALTTSAVSAAPTASVVKLNDKGYGVSLGTPNVAVAAIYDSRVNRLKPGLVGSVKVFGPVTLGIGTTFEKSRFTKPGLVLGVRL